MRRAILAALFALISTPLFATQYYVSTSGNDSNAGTQTAPFKTMNQASGIVAAGDTVHVAPGVYEVATYTSYCTLPITGGIGYSYICQTTSGTAAAPITYVSDVKWGAQLVCIGSGTQETSAWPMPMEASYIIIKGFYFSCPATVDGPVGGMYANNGHNSFIDNYVYNYDTTSCPETGIFSGSDTTYTPNSNQGYNTYDGNVIRYVGTGDATFPQCSVYHAIYDGSPHATVTNNVISAIDGLGLSMYGGGVCYDYIANNTIFDTASGGIILEEAGTGQGYTNSCPVALETDYNVVINNIVINNGFGYDNINHVFFNGQAGGIQLYTEGTVGTHNVLSNNIAFGNNVNNTGFPGSQIWAVPPAVATNNIVGPLSAVSSVLLNYQVDKSYAPTANYNYMNYSLSAGSIARGLAVGPAPSHDVNGDLRNTVDAGAFHYLPTCDAVLDGC